MGFTHTAHPVISIIQYQAPVVGCSHTIAFSFACPTIATRASSVVMMVFLFIITSSLS